MTETTEQHPPSDESGESGSTAHQPGAEVGASASQSVRLALLLVGAVACTWWLGFWGIVVIAALVVMITLHEFGHYVMAKRAGMKVTEFFLGFGPRIWSFRRGETEYGLKALPLGAYVRIIGMTGEEEVDPADEGRTYRSKPFWQRFGVAVAGSTMHGIQALVIVFFLLTVAGMPGGQALAISDEPVGWTVRSTLAGCPAGAAGIAPGDRVMTLNGKPAQDWDRLSSYIANHPGETVTLGVSRDGVLRDVKLRLAKRNIEGVTLGSLGVSAAPIEPPTKRVGVLSAIPQTFREVGSVLKASLVGLGHFANPKVIKDFGRQVVNASSDRAKEKEAQHLLDSSTSDTTAPPSTSPSGNAQSDSVTAESDKACAAAMDAGRNDQSGDPNSRLTSIVGIFQVGKSAGQVAGFRGILAILAAVNIFIGVFNLLPLPILDGGHVVVAVYEKFQERRLGLKTRYLADLTRVAPVVYVVLVMFGLLAVSTLYLDLVNPIVN